MKIYGILSLTFVCSLNLPPFMLLKVLSGMQSHTFLLSSSYSPHFYCIHAFKRKFQPNNICITNKHKKRLKTA